MGGRDWTHEALVRDLQRCRIEAGDLAGYEVTLSRHSGGYGQADVASMEPCWWMSRPTVWECKVSRSDFLSDVRTEKYRRYLPVCARLCFAAPAGLIQPAEVPDGCGLVLRGQDGWCRSKRASVRPLDDKGAADFYMALMFNLCGVTTPYRQTDASRLAECP